jgi:Ca-activated chloride channel family protein
VTFEAPNWLWLLLLVPLSLLAFRQIARSRERSSHNVVDAHLQANVLRLPPRWRERWPFIIQFAAVIALLFAASGPVASPPMPVNKAAVIVALDTSRSMLATDINPTRLEAGKEVVRQVARLLPASTLLGLVTFSSGAALLVPPTVDRSAVLTALEGVKLSQATSLSAAVVAGVRAMPGRGKVTVPRELGGAQLDPNGQGQGQNFQGTPDSQGRGQQATPIDPKDMTPAALVILSDGVSNRGADPLVAGKFATDNKVKVHAFGIGREGGTVATVDGQPYFIPFDANSMKRLAETTGGKYVFPPTVDSISGIAKELGTLIRWEPTKVKLASILAALGLALAAVGGVMSIGWNRRLP